jgi:hypothetical protein
LFVRARLDLRSTHHIMPNDPIELLKRVADRLGREVAGLSMPEKIREQFAYLQISQLNRLADGFLVLFEAGRMQIAGCLTRPLIESFLNLKAALNESTYAASKSVADMSKYIHFIKRLRDNSQPDQTKGTFEQLVIANEKTLNNLMEAHQVSLRDWNVRQIAEKAGCLPLYENAYPFFHPSVHARVDGIFPQESGLHDDLLIDIVTVVLMDTVSATIAEFYPERLSAHEEQIEAWQKEREEL